MSNYKEPSTARKHAQDLYQKMSEYVGPDHEKHCVDYLTFFIGSMEARIEELLEGGWRSCIDHIIRPDSPCPVCRIEVLEAKVEQYEAALESIAKSSCCGDCQEAKKVAEQTLRPIHRNEAGNLLL